MFSLSRKREGGVGGSCRCVTYLEIVLHGMFAVSSKPTFGNNIFELLRHPLTAQ